jgi:hypothetical protein
MLRPLTIRLNPETVAWTASFALLEVGIASCLVYFGVGGGLTLAWAAVAAGVFAAFEPGLYAWLWAVLVSREDGEPQPEARAVGVPSPEFTPPTSGASAVQDDTPPTPVIKTEPLDPRHEYEERIAKLIGTRSTNMSRIIEVVAAIALAGLSLLGSHWTPGKMPPPDQSALIDQLRSDLNSCQARVCGSDNTRGGDFGGNPPSLDPKFKQDLLDAIKAAAQPPDTFWTGSTIFGISALALLLIGLAVAIVFMVRKRPETAAPLGTLGLAATAIKEAEHLSRVDVGSYRIAEWSFVLLLVAFAVLAFWKIAHSDNTPPPAPGVEGKSKLESPSKVESPLSLLFSALVLLWALLAICYRQEHAPVPPTPPPANQKPIVGYRVLPAIPGFVPGRSDQLKSGKGLHAVAQEIVQEAHDRGARPDDMLVLLGSADCTAVRKPKELSNQALASNRATGLAAAVDSLKQFSPDHVKAESLHQGDSCTGSADLRAVVPLLIKQEYAGAADR